MAKNPHDTPLVAATEDGEVLIDGPGGIAESFTPQAARRSAEHIAKAVDDAAANDAKMKRDR